MKVVFFATPNIAIKSFEFFINSSDYEVLALVVQKPKAQGRGRKIVDREITKIAKNHSILVLEPDRISKEPLIIEKLKELKADFFITFAFGQILSQEVLDIPKYGVINLHASLLPLLRGPSPIAQAIIEGHPYSGITAMKTVLELDAGDICLQEKIDIPIDMNVIELQEEISKKSPQLLDKTLKGLYNNSLSPIPQDHTKATFTKKITKEQKAIDWTKDALSIHNKIRAMYSINTNHTTYEGKIIKILQTQFQENESLNKQGQVIELDKTGITVGCAKGSVKIITLKPEGRGQMKARDWAMGSRIKKGDFFQ